MFTRPEIKGHAGNENLKETCSQGARLKETQAINKSLASLGNVLSALVNKVTCSSLISAWSLALPVSPRPCECLSVRLCALHRVMHFS